MMPAGHNELSFTHLTPGTYRFRVKAERNNIETPERSFTIVVHSPWYRSAWAYFFYALIIGLFLWQFLTYRHNREQLFYAEVMNALGYGTNPRGFRQIAAAVPLRSVMSEPENAESAFRVASQFIDWRRGYYRPSNAPEVRLASAARLFAKGEVLSILDERDFSPRNCRRMVSDLAKGGFMGRGRAAALMANVFVPFALAEGRLAEVPEWLPPEDVCEPVRLTAFRLLGRDHNPAVAYASNGLKIQGLIQIHRDFCLRLHPECGECSLATAQPWGAPFLDNVRQYGP